MSRYRLDPTPEQELILLRHCSDARYVWNLCVEQEAHWRPGRDRMPGFAERCRQLTDARADNPWLAEGSVTVQQQAIRDHGQAMTRFFAGTHRRPSWRKAGRDEGFRVVAVSAALSTGEMLQVPGLSACEANRLRRLSRKLARARRGSGRRGRVKMAVARLKARETDRRKDWAEKVSTDIARRFDVIRVEDLRIRDMTRSAKGTLENPGRNVRAKAGLNREIRRSGWGLLIRRLEDKAPGRVEKINPVYTSQRCSACGHIARESRESQALFRCVACNYTVNADVNAASNIAAGHAVTARGGDGISQPVNREPQLAFLAL